MTTGAARRVLIAVAMLCAVTSAQAAEAFKVATQGRQLLMEISGHLLSVPGPLWTTDNGPVAAEKSQIVYRRLGSGIESVLLLPLDETVVTWTRVMGILAVARKGYSAEAQIGSMIQPMVQDCAQDQTLISRLPAAVTGGRPGLLLMCGRYRPTRATSRSCAGGLLVAVALDTPLGAVKVYHEWCTGSFNVTDRATWPVAGAVIEAHAQELQLATSFVPLEAAGPPAPVDAPPKQP